MTHPQTLKSCAIKPPADPLVNASVYAGFWMVMTNAPNISTNVIGMKRPKKVSQKTVHDEVVWGIFILLVT